MSLTADLRDALRPLRHILGRAVIPSQSETDTIIFKAAEIVSSEHVPGDYLEFGVFRGNTLIQAFHTIRRCYTTRAEDVTRIHSPNARTRVRQLWDRIRFFAFDSFQGLPALTGLDVHTQDFERGKFACTAREFVERARTHNVDLSKLITVEGWFEETCTPATIQKHDMKAAAFVHIDCDLYESTRTVLKFVEPLLVDGTVIIFDDWYSYRGNPGLGEQRAFAEWTPTLPHLTFTQFQKEGPWRNSFIVNTRI